MKILGIDQSYKNCAWVVLNKETTELIECGLIQTSIKDGNIFERARKIVNSLVEIVEKYKIDVISIEGLSFGGMGNATRDLAGLQFLIIDNISPLPYHIIAPTSVKKFAVPNKIKGKKTEKKDLYENLPELVKYKFGLKGVKKTTGLFDLTDAYFIGMYTIEHKI